MDYLGRIITKNPTAPTVGSAKGIWTLDEAMQYQKAGTWPLPQYPFSRSVRLRGSATAYLGRTPSSASNRDAWTWSSWVKLGTLTTNVNWLLLAGTQSVTDTGLYFYSDNTLQFFNRVGSTVNGYIYTTAVFRDPSAWYHVVAVYDSTNATATDRMQLWVNGIRQTVTVSTQLSSGADSSVNNNVAHFIGAIQAGGTSANNFDGYMTGINFIDGQALAPTSFGAFDATTGVWNPIVYTGTYGTNGFFLSFSDPTSTTTLSQDYSGNANNWTANNISLTSGVTYDSMVDTTSNSGTDTGVGNEVRGSYCTGNPLWAHTSTIALSNGNLTAVWPGYWFGGTIGMSTGKWYWEFQITAGTVGSEVGIASITRQQDQGLSNSTGGNAYGYRNDGQKFINATFSAYGSSYTTNDIISIAYDATNATIAFYKNGVGQGTAFTGIVADTYLPAFGNTTGSSMTAQLNFGQRQFVYTAPSGYKALCTQNLPTATISNGANYMAATLYTGTGASLTVSNAVNSISFQPDLVWIKSRSAATDHKLTDSVRGTTKALISNTTGAETTDSTGLTAFGSSGFTVGANTTYNNSGATYVGWQWKASGSTVSNTSGSITSTVSANTTAGFSIFTYTGTGANATVGHGLGVTPGLGIFFKRSGADNHAVWHSALPASGYNLWLDTTSAQNNTGNWFNATNPTSSVFSLGTNSGINGSAATYVAYCFAPISGYSAFGSYTGTGSTDGPFVFTGFRPRWILAKATSTGYWHMFDSSRPTYNPETLVIYPSIADAEATVAGLDFLSNGFKLRYGNAGINGSGDTIIYAAFAENPFTIARAR